jgi:hypothetical protein
MATASVAAAGLSAERGAGQNPPASRTPLLLLAHSNFRANFVAISNGGDNNSQQFHFLKADRVHWRGGGTARVAASPKIVASSSSDF